MIFEKILSRGPQYVNTSDYPLIVTGLTTKTDVYTYQDILAMYPHYTKIVTLFCVEGWDATILWEGVLVSDLIREAGIDPRANTVIFTAHDGYTTSFPLDYLMNHDIIMAYKMNNVTLPADRGLSVPAGRTGQMGIQVDQVDREDPGN